MLKNGRAGGIIGSGPNGGDAGMVGAPSVTAGTLPGQVPKLNPSSAPTFVGNPTATVPITPPQPVNGGPGQVPKLANPVSSGLNSISPRPAMPGAKVAY